MKQIWGQFEGKGRGGKIKEKHNEEKMKPWEKPSPEGRLKKDEAPAKITPGGQLIGPLVHKIFHLDSYPRTHTRTNKNTNTHTNTHK